MNGYGLISLVPSTQQEPEGYIPRVEHQAIAETRQTELGTLHLYEGFVELRDKAKDVKPGSDEEPDGRERTSRGETELARRLGEAGKVSESCVDWKGLRGELGVDS